MDKREAPPIGRDEVLQAAQTLRNAASGLSSVMLAPLLAFPHQAAEGLRLVAKAIRADDWYFAVYRDLGGADVRIPRQIDGIRIECFLVPGHTWGHMVYLIDGKYLFTGDTIWLGADGGYSFISALAEDNRLAVRSLAELETKLEARKLHPMFLTGHTGWTDNFTFAFAHKDKLCSPFKKRVHDPSAPYDAYDESDDTEERSKSGYLKGVGR